MMLTATSDGWRVYVQEQNYFDRTVDVFLIQDFGGDRYRVLQPDMTTMEMRKDEAVRAGTVKPTFQLLPEQLQALADGLADKGFLPKQRRFAEEITLLRDHLEDMRRLVFKKETP